MTERGAGARPGRQKVAKSRKRTASSRAWLERQLNDPYVAQAKRDGYRSRAAYKLIELDDRFRLFATGGRVIDLGAAPGGWSQVAAERVGRPAGRGAVVGIDLLEMDPVPGVAFERMDFMDAGAPAHLQAGLGGPADVGLSDMAAQATGRRRTDSEKISGLAQRAPSSSAPKVVAPVPPETTMPVAPAKAPA